jgi:hypothetical protein
VLHRVSARDTARLPADHHAELDLKIERVRALGPDDRLAVGDGRVGELREQERSLGSRLTAFATCSR